MLQVVSTNIPPVGTNEVLIRMKLSAINPSDLLLIKGRYPGRVALPATPGYEGMGIIIEKGNCVKNSHRLDDSKI